MRVEILMAVYNGERFLEEQLDSIFAQTDSRWHLTVSDDGSADRSLRILEAAQERHPEQVRLVHSGRRFGSAKAHFWWLLQQCRAELVMLCDQDDVWFPQKVEGFLSALEALPPEERQRPCLFFSDQIPTDEQLHPLSESLMRYQKQNPGALEFQHLVFQNVVTGGASMANRALVDKALQCRAPEEMIEHDYWLALVASRFGQIRYLDRATSYYRQHGDNVEGAKSVNSLDYLRRMSKGGRIRQGILNKKRQAKAFVQTYEQELGAEETAFLREFSLPSSGWSFKIRSLPLIYGTLRKTGFLLYG